MVTERSQLECEVQAILHHIDDKCNFLLSGGAGSGKTYSLVQVIKQVIIENPMARIACVTYTNAAVREIEGRVNHENLNVSTIHDFLWDNIKHFQQELKSAILELAQNEECKDISIDEKTPIPPDYFDRLEEGIQYKEYLKIKKGIISHDQVLAVANRMFEKYPKLSDVVKDKFQFIFMDEYQDTHENVIEIFLCHFRKSEKQTTIGFFGDAMQSIYDDGIGNLAQYTGDTLKEVKKAQNRRNPQNVIDLANKLRTDGITQRPSSDTHAPNMRDGRVKKGSILFIHSCYDNIGHVETYLTKEHGWDFNDASRTKELNLTNSLIADKAGFRRLMSIYDKDRILEYVRKIRKHLQETAISEDFSQYTLGDVIDRIGSKCRPTKPQAEFIRNNFELYNTAKNCNYLDISQMYVNKDHLIDDKKQDPEEESKKGSQRDSLIKHLFKIQNNIMFYKTKQYSEFLRATDYRSKIIRVENKQTLKNNIESLVNVGNKTIEEVIFHANQTGICLMDDLVNNFRTKKKYLYDRVKEVPFSEFQKLYHYLEGNTPFSTQHKTKGTEFDNVLVILDNGKWTKFNFEYLFLEKGNENVRARTRRIFYVCCTRTKEQLAIFYHKPSSDVIDKATEWFGADNIISLTVK